MKNFSQVSNQLYRGGKPSLQDLINLKKKYQINLIISLDEKIGKSLSPYCQKLNIKHLILPFQFTNWNSILQMFNPKLFQLFQNANQKIFVHCYHGRDRTGLFCALYRCLLEQWAGLSAILEAFSYGFGGSCHPTYIKQIANLLCKIFSQPKSLQLDEQQLQDNIVNQVKDFDMNLGLNRLDHLSWSPFEDYRVRQYPYVDTYKYMDEQYPSRDDLTSEFEEILPYVSENTMPQVGQYDVNTQGIMGFGPSYIGTGIIT